MSTTTMVFPKAVNLLVRNAEGKRVTLQFKAGAQEVPNEHVEHPYLKANGVTKYDHEAVAAKARKEAEEAQRKADEATAKAKGIAGRPQAAKAAAAPQGGQAAPGGQDANQAPGSGPKGTEPDYDGMTVEDLKDALDAKGVGYEAKAKKADLIDLLKQAG